MGTNITQKQGKLEDEGSMLESMNAAIDMFKDAVRGVVSKHNPAFVLLEGKAEHNVGSGLQNMYPTVTETCIVRPPGQCITIKNANFGDRAELWLDISSLGVIDLAYLCEQLTEIFSTMWDFPAIVTLPGEE